MTSTPLYCIAVAEWYMRQAGPFVAGTVKLRWLCATIVVLLMCCSVKLKNAWTSAVLVQLPPPYTMARSSLISTVEW